MRVCVQKIIVLASEKNGALRKGSTAFLYHLYNNYKQELLCQLPLLPVNVQLEVRRVLIPYAPNLDDELLHSAKSESAPKKTLPSSATPHKEYPLQNHADEGEDDINDEEFQEDISSFEQVEEEILQQYEEENTIANRRNSFICKYHHTSNQWSYISLAIHPTPKMVAGKDAELKSALSKLSADNAQTRKEGIYNIIEFSRENDLKFWETHFVTITTASINLTKDEDVSHIVFFSY
jgi:hypothetical protein